MRTRLQSDYIDREPSEPEQFDLNPREQEKISRILNAKNIDDKTKFLMLAALQSEMHKTRLLPGIKVKKSSVTTQQTDRFYETA